MTAVTFEEWDAEARRQARLYAAPWGWVASASLVVHAERIDLAGKMIYLLEHVIFLDGDEVDTASNWSKTMEAAARRGQGHSRFYSTLYTSRMVETACLKCGAGITVTPMPDEDLRRLVCPECRGVSPVLFMRP